jgi:hypothetical protein
VAALAHQSHARSHAYASVWAALYGTHYLFCYEWHDPMMGNQESSYASHGEGDERPRGGLRGNDHVGQPSEIAVGILYGPVAFIVLSSSTSPSRQVQVSQYQSTCSLGLQLRLFSQTGMFIVWFALYRRSVVIDVNLECFLGRPSWQSTNSPLGDI